MMTEAKVLLLFEPFHISFLSNQPRINIQNSLHRYNKFQHSYKDLMHMEVRVKVLLLWELFHISIPSN